MSVITPLEKLAMYRNRFMVACSEYLDYYQNPIDTVSIEILEAEMRRHGQKYYEFKKSISHPNGEKSPTE